MKSQESNNKTTGNHIADSSGKTARGSKSVHSEKDNSTESGFERKEGNKKKEEE